MAYTIGVSEIVYFANDQSRQTSDALGPFFLAALVYIIMTIPCAWEGKLSVVLYDLPPFSKLEGNKLAGVDGDIVNAIAEMECLSVSAKSVATAANIPTVQAGRADLSIAAWYRTASRAEIVGLTEPIYTDQMAIISKDGLDDAEQLKGKTVGTVDGYLWVDDMKKLLGDSLKVYPTTLNMNQDLDAGRIDIGIDSYGSAQFNKRAIFRSRSSSPMSMTRP